jgi:hypothetical protein
VQTVNIAGCAIDIDGAGEIALALAANQDGPLSTLVFGDNNSIELLQVRMGVGDGRGN